MLGCIASAKSIKSLHVYYTHAKARATLLKAQAGPQARTAWALRYLYPDQAKGFLIRCEGGHRLPGPQPKGLPFGFTVHVSSPKPCLPVPIGTTSSSLPFGNSAFAPPPPPHPHTHPHKHPCNPPVQQSPVHRGTAAGSARMALCTTAQGLCRPMMAVHTAARAERQAVPTAALERGAMRSAGPGLRAGRTSSPVTRGSR